ncbi:MAG: alpha/beta hydrolase [Campylobacterales bacterium]|nr:alpha/beta hydrolase [Campylobacterales bacterium]
MLKWLILPLVVYVGALVYMYVTQERQIFNAAAIQTPFDFSCQGCEVLRFDVAPEVTLEGKRRAHPHGPVLLYFGGNADDATRLLLHLDPALELEVVAFNYRGYVKSGGKPSQEALFADALRVYDTFTKERDVIVMGRSLGTGVATYLAANRPTQKLVLITPYDSIRSLAKASYPYFPIDWLIRHPFESTRYMSEVSAPVFLVEVEGDTVTPRSHLLALSEKIAHIALHVTLQETTHGEVLTAFHKARIMEKILTF